VEALFFDFLPSDLLELGASEPAAPVAQPDLRSQHTLASSKRAA
jgi:hypothetical protein